jgi:hypothetical protein
MFFLRLKLVLLPLVVVLNAGPAVAQMTSLWVETVLQHEGIMGNTDFSGMTTYRIHALMTSETDFLGAAYGNALEPCSMVSTTSFYQHPAGGSFGTDINAFFIGILPDLNYDSWVTIGLESSPQSGNGDGISTIGMGAELSVFESGDDLVVESEIGGSWFVLPTSTNGIAGSDLMVLLAQLTTDGLIEGNLNLQVFIGGNPFDEQLVSLTFSAGAPGCTDGSACNFAPEANADDGSCLYAAEGYACAGSCLLDVDGDGVCDPFEIAGCPDPLACNYAEDITDMEDCEFPLFAYGCDGICLSDWDQDGVCDPLEIAGCSDSEACNYAPEATDEDGSCWYTELHRNCLGECLLDADQDGICDEEEMLGCTISDADNFDAAATDDDGSCLFVGCQDTTACNFDVQANSPGDCTYAMAELDCAGMCLIDTDGDGVCDAFELLGCMNGLAENFNSLATDEDGSCVIIPSSYCGDGTVWDDLLGQCVSDGSGDVGIGGYGGPCFGDFDGNGSRTVSDLLLWLPYYDTSCD